MAEVFGGAFTVEKVSEGETVVTKLVYHYNFGVSGITMDEAGQVSVVAKLMEAKGSAASREMVAVNRTLVGRTLTVTLNGDDADARRVFTVTNPVFDAEGTCTVPIAADALRRGTNTFEVSVAAP